MTALIIIGAIILLFAFLFHATVNAEIGYYGGKLDFKVTYLFLTLFPLVKKEKKVREKKNKSKKKGSKDKKSDGAESVGTDGTSEAAEVGEGENTSEIDGETEELLNGGKKKEKVPVKDKIADIKKKLGQFKIIWEFCKKPLLRLFKGIYIDDLTVDFKICGEDACEAAVNYGRVGAVFYNLLNVIRTMFPISVRTVDIVCDFDGRESVYDGGCAVRLRLGTIVAAALVVLWGFVVHLNELNNVGETEVDSDKKM